MNKIEVLIVDDHPLVLEGIKTLLADSEEVSIKGSASNAFDAIAFLKLNTVDIVLLDINLPNINGIELCKRITNSYPDIKCIALSTFSEKSYITRMFQNGAKGYLLKNSKKEEIVEAITKVYNGGQYMNIYEDMPTNELSGKPKPFLTPREKEVLLLISEGMTNQQIAEKLFVSVLTVNSHRTNLLAKFEVSNTALLIKAAIQQGLI
jgi:DNA-binding NarL/FixJ family response regulator